jgi:hypothetical protein
MSPRLPPKENDSLLPVGELVRQLMAHGAAVTLDWRAGGPQPAERVHTAESAGERPQHFRMGNLAGFPWPAKNPSDMRYFPKFVASMDAAVTTGDTAEAIAEEIRKIAASQKHVTPANYGRRLLKQVERHLGLAPGSLSARVIPKATGPRPDAADLL